MADIDFNEPSVGQVNSTRVALDVKNNGTGGCIKCTSFMDGTSAEGSGTGVTGITITKFGRGIFGDAQHAEGGTGVIGKSKSWVGVWGEADTGAGVVGVSKNWVGVHGACTQRGGHGVFGEAQHPESGAGVIGTSKNWVGVYGESETKIGVWGRAPLAGYFQGDVEVTGDIRLVNADCAEDFDVSESEEGVEPGTVMVLNEMGQLQSSYQEYDKKVAGIISGAMGYMPAIVLGRKNGKQNRNRLSIALVGKVYCKVDARSCSIEIGDLLTTSSTKGHAMKAEDSAKAFGTVIGKALDSLKDGLGLIPVLVALQ